MLRSRSGRRAPWLPLALLGVAAGCPPSVPRASDPATTPPGRPTPTPTPRASPPANPIVELASRSQHTCARRRSGDVLCWGRNDQGQLGDGRRRDSARLVKVAGLVDATEIVTGHDFSCARRKDATVVCWGNDFDGQLGDGRGDRPGAASLRPTKVTGLGGIVALSTGEYHACALDRGGTVECWGNGDDGQIGSDARRAFPTPQPITQLGPATQIAAGWSHVCALEAKGTVGCWGRNTEGQLGDGKSGSRIKPVRVAGLDDAVELVSGHDHSCARRRTGQVVCWGDNSGGQLGPAARGAAKSNVPVVVADLGPVVQLAAGGHHNCARVDTGRVICWGSNDAGQLGTAKAQARATTRVVVRGIDDAIDLALGARHSCALRTAGEVSCWGDAQHGALGPYPLF